MDGKQEFDIIDPDAKQLGMFWIFAKYIFPVLIGIVCLALAVAFYFFELRNLDIL